MRFEELGLSQPIVRAALDEGYTAATPIQIKAIPHVLEGRDVLGCAQTGTGKTAAFAMPILHHLGRGRPQGHQRGRHVRVLVLAPTRELAAQIGDSFGAYGRHTPARHAVIFGGVNQNPQARALRDGVEVLVATPGRLLDLMEQGLVDLRHVQVLVLDEADRMLDMGFIRDIRKIVAKVPAERQTLLFSATMPPDIRKLAGEILRRPVSVHVPAASLAAETVEQSVYFVEKREKPAMLAHFLNHNAVRRALVFTRTKHGADRVARHLSRVGIPAEAIHGNKSQNARVRAMDKFKSTAPPVLVATDIAARGLDIDDVSHVINYDVPNVPETYVHRIGRTGRAGASGLAVSFCDTEERAYLGDIERLICKAIPARADQPTLPAAEPLPARRPHRAEPVGAPQATPTTKRRRRRGSLPASKLLAPSAPAATTRQPGECALAEPAAKSAWVGHRSRGRRRTRRGVSRSRR